MYQTNYKFVLNTNSYNNQIFTQAKMNHVKFQAINRQPTERRSQNTRKTSKLQRSITPTFLNQSNKVNLYQQLQRLTKVMNSLIQIASEQKYQKEQKTKRGQMYQSVSTKEENTNQNQSNIFIKKSPQTAITTQLESLQKAILDLNSKVSSYEKQTKQLHYHLEKLQVQNLQWKSLYQNMKYVFQQKKNKQDCTLKNSYKLTKSKNSGIKSKLQTLISQQSLLFTDSIQQNSSIRYNSPSNSTPNLFGKATFTIAKQKFQDASQIISIGKTQQEFSDIIDNKCYNTQNKPDWQKIENLLQTAKKNHKLFNGQSTIQNECITSPKHRYSQKIRIICQKAKIMAKQQYLENIAKINQSTFKDRTDKNNTMHLQQ